MTIIQSLLDTDFYKFTMAQVVFHNYTDAWVKYKFKCRNGTGVPDLYSPEDFIIKIQRELDSLCDLNFTEDELEYLSSIPFMSPDFIEFLRCFKL